MKKTTRKVPQSVKTQRKIDAALAQQEQVNRRSVALMLSRHLAQIEMLKKPASTIAPNYVVGVLDETIHTGWIVKNWHTAWKWISTWAFGLIAYVSVVGVPPEVIALVPEASQGKVTAVLALIGFVGRFLNQSRDHSKSSPTPPLQKEGL